MRDLAALEGGGCFDYVYFGCIVDIGSWVDSAVTNICTTDTL